MKKIFLLTLLAAFAAAAFAQNVQRCATDDYIDYMAQQDPTVYTKRQQIKNEVAQRLQGMQYQKQGAGVVYTIPVVVHVVYNTSTENISDAQILSQIQILNEDFRRMNADTTNTPGVFKPFAADAEIQFCLASRDPQGNSTNGITRTYTNKTIFGYNNDIKQTASGGKNPWPATDYLNIWVCDLGAGLLGFAQPPGMNSSTDGVVVLYTAFGNIGTAQAPFNKGRTATHEVGHWLNLEHIWGSNGCSMDDGVNDTPKASGPHYSCGTYNTCTDSPTDYNDMVQNYMDYTEDGCMNLFTQGQRTRMRDALVNYRSGLLTSLGCVPPNSAPLADFTSDVTYACPGMPITFSDASINSVTNWQWSFPGGTPATSTAASPVVSYATPGFYDITLIASNSFGSDTITKTAYIEVAGANGSLPFVETFQGIFPSPNWTVYNPDSDRTWIKTTTAGGFGQSTASVVIDNFDTQSDPTGNLDGLFTPRFDLSSLSSPYLKFDVAYARYNNTFTDTLLLYYSTDCGDTYNPFWAKGGAALATAPDQTTAFTPTSSQWRTDSISLAQFSNESNISFALVNKSGWGNKLYLDNIQLAAVVATPPLANFAAGQTSICSGGSVTFQDMSGSLPANWSWTFTGPATLSSNTQNPVISFSTPGTYDVKLVVTNSAGSDSVTISNYITVFPAPQVSFSKTDVLCFGEATGFASVSANGGSSPYSYNWSTGAASSSVSNLTSGNYFVTVTDGNGCEATTSMVISQPSKINVSISATNSGAGQSNGTGTVVPSGGVPPYTYSWNDPAEQTTSTATGLAGGAYLVTIIDANNCEKIVQVTVQEDQSSGVVAEGAKPNVKIFPNPARDYVNVQFDLPNDQVKSVELMNVIGSTVYAGAVTNQREVRLNTSALPAGVYFVVLKTDKQNVVRRFEVTR